METMIQQTYALYDDTTTFYIIVYIYYRRRAADVLFFKKNKKHMIKRYNICTTVSYYMLYDRSYSASCIDKNIQLHIKNDRWECSVSTLLLCCVCVCVCVCACVCVCMYTAEYIIYDSFSYIHI